METQEATPTPTPAPVETASPEIEATPPVEAEAVATPEPEKEKEDPKFARRFAALSRQEKQILAKSKEVEEKAKEFEAVRQEAERSKAILQLAKENPVEFLKETGISYQELTELMLAAEKTPEDKKFDELKKEIEDLKQAKEIEAKELEKAKTEAQIERVTQAIEDYKVQCKNTVQQNPDKYELIIAHGREDDVFNIVEQYFIENETVLDFDIAADYLEQLLYEEAQKLIKTKKLAPTIKQDAIRDISKDARDTQKPSPTLTNTKSSGYAPSFKPTSQQDAFKRAVAILESE
jgi:hypothetical protein